MRALLLGVAALALIGAGVAIFVWSGAYNVGADTPHFRAVYALLEKVRERSVAVRARGIQVPPLDAPERVAAGAGRYEKMCAVCHLAPGVQDNALRNGLNPRPPKLAEEHAHEPAQTFWIIKHGLKMTGMPAWGASNDDQAIWDIVAFLGRLPEMSAAEYRRLVDSGAAPVSKDEGRHGGMRMSDGTGPAGGYSR